MEREGFELRGVNKLVTVRQEFPGGEMFVTAEEKKMAKYRVGLKKFKKDLKRMAIIKAENIPKRMLLIANNMTRREKDRMR